MYFPYYVAYMTAGFIISLAVFFWALNQGQFRDQDRARFIPLEADGGGKPVAPSRFARIQTITLFALVGIGLAASAAVIAFALLKAVG